jgi:hypothetical protein
MIQKLESVFIGVYAFFSTRDYLNDFFPMCLFFESDRMLFDSKPRDFYRRGILMLPDKWSDVIDAEGDYFNY